MNFFVPGQSLRSVAMWRKVVFRTQEPGIGVIQDVGDLGTDSRVERIRWPGLRDTVKVPSSN
jgi:hypothetical protein